MIGKNANSFQEKGEKEKKTVMKKDDQVDELRNPGIKTGVGVVFLILSFINR